MSDSMVLVLVNGEDINVAYASPDAEVYIDGTLFEATVPSEVYYLEDQDAESLRAFWREVYTRRNKDVAQGLIGG